MDGVGWDGEDGVGGEVVLEYGDAGAGGYEAREAERGGRVDAEGFVDYVVEACGRDLLVWVLGESAGRSGGEVGEGRKVGGLTRAGP